jgi:hypothetical protein
MVRYHEDEINHRRKLRKKYLEDPNFRRWSDIAPDGDEIDAFDEWRDDFLFCCFITNNTDIGFTVSDLVEYLNRGDELPINWVNFYAYFDERLNDPENRYLSTLVEPVIYNGVSEPRMSVKELLNQYRDKLLSTYDII